MTNEQTHEERAYEYLRRISGTVIADWAKQEQNGTWKQALELTQLRNSPTGVPVNEQ